MSLPEPLYASDRCSVRYASLSAAKSACVRAPSCTGVVDDGGLTCHGTDMQYELRKSTWPVPSPTTTAWQRLSECPSPPPSPLPPAVPPPTVSPPIGWTCFDEHEDSNLADPLEEDRCAVRFGLLSAAKLACLDRLPACTGIVDDAGFTCNGRNMQFELRKDAQVTRGVGSTAWVRTACPTPPSLPPPPPTPPRPPSPPWWWSCFAELANQNLADPLSQLTGKSRCSVRFSSLVAAKTACLFSAPHCTGVVDDGGMTCDGQDRQFELRTDSEATPWVGATSWARVQCPSPWPPPSLPPSPAPPPALPRPPAPPIDWMCFTEHPFSNMARPLSDDRCSVRFTTLWAAQTACLSHAPDCTGVVDDGGLDCVLTVSPYAAAYGPPFGNMAPTSENRQFELRRDSLITPSFDGATTWARAACPSPPPPPAAPPDVFGGMMVIAISTTGGASLALVVACLLYAWSSYRRLNPPLLLSDGQGGSDDDATALDASQSGLKSVNEADTSHLLSPSGINFYLKQPGVGLYESIKALGGTHHDDML